MKTIIISIAGLVLLTGIIFSLYLLYRRQESKRVKRAMYDYQREPSAGGHILQDVTTSVDDYDALMDRLVSLFETDKLCLKSDVRINEVAQALSVGKGTLSKAIKLKTGKNFCQLVHYYRVREAMRLYANHPKLGVKEISRMVGFNSQTTFITAFGRHTGCTPAEWCRKFRERSKTDTYGFRNKRRKSA